MKRYLVFYKDDKGEIQTKFFGDKDEADIFAEKSGTHTITIYL